jgi:transposase
MTSGARSVSARSRELLAVAPAQMRAILSQHLQRRGGRMVIVNPAWTSSTCEVCGHIDSRSRRGSMKFTCMACNYNVDADYNAARIIARLGSGLPEVGGNSGPVSWPRETDDVGREPEGRKSHVRQNPIVRASMPRGSIRSTMANGEQSVNGCVIPEILGCLGTRPG